MTERKSEPWPVPEECEHPRCKKQPIVGFKKRYVCEDHVKWVQEPIRDVVRLAVDNSRE